MREKLRETRGSLEMTFKGHVSRMSCGHWMTVFENNRIRRERGETVDAFTEMMNIKRKSAPLLEKDIEDAVCEYAKGKGMLCYKFVSPSYRSVPDRMVIVPGDDPFIFFIEFKSETGKLTPGQNREIRRLTDAGVTVLVVNNVEEGKKLIDRMIVERKGHAS